MGSAFAATRLTSRRSADDTWPNVRREIVARATPRIADALRDDPVAALPWVSLALYDETPPAWLRSLYRYCRAVAERDGETRMRLAEHVIALPEAPPPAILDALTAAERSISTG